MLKLTLKNIEKAFGSRSGSPSFCYSGLQLPVTKLRRRRSQRQMSRQSDLSKRLSMETPIWLNASQSFHWKANQWTSIRSKIEILSRTLRTASLTREKGRRLPFHIGLSIKCEAPYNDASMQTRPRTGDVNVCDGRNPLAHVELRIWKMERGGNLYELPTRPSSQLRGRWTEDQKDGSRSRLIIGSGRVCLRSEDFSI